MKAKYVQWFLGELDGLCDQQVLTPDVADRLRAYYRERTASGHRLQRNLVFSVLGALLIGGGVILLLAHNWEDLGRPIRAILALLPVAISLCVTGYALTRKTGSAPWCEAAGTALSLSIAAAVALISQTYHLSEVDFLLTWSLLALPAVYLLRAAVPAMLYLATILFWAHDGPTYGYWLLLAAVLPFLAVFWRRNTARGTFLGWCVAVSLPFAVSLTFDGMEKIWIYALSFLFAGMALDGLRRSPEVTIRTPLALAGLLGVMGITFLLTFKSLAGELIPSGLELPYGWADGHVDVDEMTTWTLLAGLAAGVVSLFVHTLSRPRAVTALLGAFPFLAVLIVLAPWPTSTAITLFNVVLAALSLTILGGGLRDGHSRWAYLGLTAFSVQIIARFFESDLPLTVRGLAFVVVGLAFLAVNRALDRRGSEHLNPALGEAS